MTFADEMRTAAVDILTDLGTTCVLQKVVATYAGKSSGDMDGTVTETVTPHAVLCSDLIGETQGYGVTSSAQAVGGAMILSASGMTVAPEINDRILFQARTFAVQQVETINAQGEVVAYQLTLSELGAT